MRWGWLFFWAALASATTSFLPAAAAAQSDSSSDAEARRRFDEGRAHFDAGEFAEAASAFRRAYVLSPRYPLLYNIGQAELRAGRDAEALEAFEGFLRQAPADDGRRGEVEERIRVLRAMGVSATTGMVATSGSGTPTDPEPEVEVEAEAEAEVEVEPTPPPAAPPSSGGSDPAPWIVAGLGGVVLVTGGVLVGVAVSDAASVTGAADGTRWSDISRAADGANAELGAGIVLLGVGAAALATGLVWGATAQSGGTEARVAFGPGSVSVSGSF